MGEFAEVRCGQHHTPGSIEPRPVLQVSQQSAMRAENGDEPEPRTAHWVMLGGVLLGIGYVDVGSNGLDVKRSEVTRNAIIIESFF